MVLKAHLEPAVSTQTTEASTEARSSDRRALWLETSGVLPGGLEANVQIHNISAAGLLLESDLPLSQGESFEIDLPEAGSVSAVIVWQSGRLFGCAFETALSDAAVAAVQLRAGLPDALQDRAIGSHRELQARAPSEPLGIKLNRLRRERGLTLAQVASVLDVSKPTVWAWEKGKARPLPDRMGQIAEVLGVSVQDLEDRLGDGQHTALVQECRLRIATAYGTHPSKVRIMIEV
ncbi:MAG: helix-turn-helix transcriptional regulator [Erythrobacter sp.]